MQATTHAIPHAGTHEAHHEEEGFWRKYIFSTDHKVIGIQYGLTALAFLLFGFCLMLMMRWQIAHPGQPIPLLGPILEKLLGSAAAGKGVMSPDLTIRLARCTGRSWCFWRLCRWRSPRLAITSCRS